MKKNIKQRMLLISIMLIILMVAGTTLAYLHTTTGTVENEFVPTNVDCLVCEEFANNEKSKVSVQNTGTVDAFIRAEVVVTWKTPVYDNEGNLIIDEFETYGATPVLGEDYTISFNTDGSWDEGSDGFYYYKGIVAPGASTDVLINSCAPVAGKAPEGYYLSVEIIASAIQADGVSLGSETAGSEENVGKTPVELAWGVTQNGNTISK